MTNNNSSSSGIGFFGLLFITFLILKLLKIISWSWWWITAPLWGPAILVITMAVVFFTVLHFISGAK